MIHLTLDELLLVGEHAIGLVPVVRDVGLLESALARPRASAFGAPAYGTLEEQAGALLHSLARNHALVDGNKRLALGATIAFLGLNGFRLSLTNDEVYGLIVAVADGSLDDVPTIAQRLAASIEPR